MSATPAEESAEAMNAEPSRFVVDGWLCESFENQTGHAVGRSAKHNATDLQLCLTAGETDGSEPQTIPASVMSWLLEGER